MARSRRQAGEDPRPIITYSHMPPEMVDGREEPHALDPEAAIIDAVEVPLVADGDPLRAPRRAPDLRVTDRVGPDLRADVRDDSFGDEDAIAAAVFDEPRRRRGGRLLFFVALIAIAGGAGAVAASLGVFAPPPKVAAPLATSADPAAELIAIHKQIDALGDASTPEAQAELAKLTKRLAELEQSGLFVSGQPAAADAAPASDIGPAVRQISLTPDDAATETAKPAAEPPAPRVRPAKPATSEVSVAPEEDMPVAEPIFPRPLKPAPKAAAVPRQPAPAGAAPSDDGFIASVEKALADSNANRPEAAPPAQPMGDAAPLVLGAPPQPLRPPPMASAPPAEAAPIAIAPQPGDPAALPKLDTDAADPYALPAPPPVAVAEPPSDLPPGLKLPPADIPNVSGTGQQY
ncbi:MAG: hypothetical protein J0H94_10170 [Rhizobiales bacterium]|nr:hypothetical protein [Hyphomicrobiales bacterium]